MQTLPNFTKLRPRTIKQAVKRNLNRFPPDFMFELSSKEEASPTWRHSLWSQVLQRYRHARASSHIFFIIKKGKNHVF
jgi:hypothetical protein